MRLLLNARRVIEAIARISMPLAMMLLILIRPAYGAVMYFQVTPELDQVKAVLSSVGPSLSGILFVVAGIMYAIGQMLPPEKKAQFHTTAVNIIIGAIVVGVLSVASTSLSIATSHLLNNVTVNSTVNSTG